MWWTPSLNLLLISLLAGWDGWKGASERESSPEINENLFEGDMLYSPLMGRSGLRDEKFRWPDRTIYYEFDKYYPKHMHQRFIDATEYISKLTCLKFQDRTTSLFPSTKDYVLVWDDDTCYADVGRIGGLQFVSLPPHCEFGNAVHEILHAVGFHHEQSRTDRDNYVEILWENIKSGSERNFRSYPQSRVTSFGVPYDYGSIMHYGSSFFSRDGSPTIKPLAQIPDSVLGQRTHMSEKDVMKVNRMYECDVDYEK